MKKPTLLFETFLAPLDFKTYQYVTEYIEHVTRVPTFLLPGESTDDFATGDADVGCISSLSYLRLLCQKPCPVEPIAIPVQGKTEALKNQGDQDAFPSLFNIITRSEHPIMALSDLRDGIWTYPRRGAQIEDDFLHEGIMSSWDAKEIIEAASPAQSLRLVLDGRAHATLLEARLMNIILRNSPRMMAQLRIVGTYSTSAHPLLVVASRISPLLKRKIQDALLTMDQDVFFAQRLREGGIMRFIPASHECYQESCTHHWQEHTNHFLAC